MAGNGHEPSSGRAKNGHHLIPIVLTIQRLRLPLEVRQLRL